MPEPTAGQHTAAGVATAGIEVREPVSAGAVAADDTTADDKVSAANEAASKGDVQQSIDVAQDAQEAAQAVQEAAQAGVSQSSGGVTPTKAEAAPQNLQATSTGFGAHKTTPQDGDEPTPDTGSLPSRSVIPSCLFLQLHKSLSKNMTVHLTLYQALQQSHGAGCRPA